MAATQNDLLQRFIDNEKKSKRWTLLSVIAFCVFALAIIYLAGALSKANKKIEDQHARLDEALKKANIAVDSLRLNEVSLQNMSDDLSRIKRERDSLVSLLKKMPATAIEINDQYVQTILTESATRRYTVYIQYMNNYQNESKQIASILPTEYYVPGTERITKFTFPSAVKYFNDDDRSRAQALANLVNTHIDKFRSKPIRVIKANNVKAPRGQLEIWLGDYVPLNTGDIIRKYSPVQQQIKQYKQ